MHKQHTRLTDLIPSHLPLLQAPMAGAQGSSLALAVCTAGGVGGLPAAMLSPEGLRAELQVMRDQATGPWNVNFFCHTPPEPDAAAEARWRQALRPFYDEAGIDPASVSAGAGRVPFSHAVADVVEPFAPPVVSFHFGLPAPDLLARVKGWAAGYFLRPPRCQKRFGSKPTARTPSLPRGWRRADTGACS